MLVCAVVGCPPLRNEVYLAARLEEQLQAQAQYVHTHERWFRLDAEAKSVSLTKLYKWYGGDFKQAAGSVLEYVASQVPELKKTLEAGKKPQIQWLDYSWKLNSKENIP